MHSLPTYSSRFHSKFSSQDEPLVPYSRRGPILDPKRFCLPPPPPPPPPSGIHDVLLRKLFML